MASITLRLKSHHHKPSSNHTFSLLFSSSSSSSSNNNNNNNNGGNSGEKPYPFSAYFTEIKSKLKQQQQQQSPSFSNINNVFTPQGSSTPSKVESLDEIRKNLSEFRRRSSVSTPEFPLTFQRNVRNPNPNPNIVGENHVLSFEKIRASLRNLNATVGEKGKSVNEQMSLNNYRQNLRMRPTMAEQQQQRGGSVGVGGGHMVIGGSLENLPANVFGKEMKEKEGKSGKDGGGKAKEEEDEMELITSYTHDQLGQKLRELRPEGKGKKGGKNDWFSLSELGERLKKLKEIELKKLDGSGAAFKELRTHIRHLRDDKEESNNAPIQSIDILSSPSFMLSPPKENLVEKYFHPDNMSAEEKLKLELKRIRDEFKMHESDCGSTRVQIAQLTTEILHLSSVLHKKDKHSRRGLLAKVQQRKKLLKYLRRTDWESYSFVLSKLGLRDNPDYKN